MAAHQAPPSLGFSRQETGVGCHFLLQCIKVKSESEVVQSCLTLSDPTDRSPPGSSVLGIFQARVLEWGASAFSKVEASGMQVLCRGQSVSGHTGQVQGQATIWRSLAPWTSPDAGPCHQLLSAPPSCSSRDRASIPFLTPPCSLPAGGPGGATVAPALPRQDPGRCRQVSAVAALWG